MYNKKETSTFYAAELMIERNKTFEEAAKMAGMSEDQKETLKRNATTTNMPIKDYMRHVSFYDRRQGEGNLLRWWLEKTLAEQTLFIVFLLGVLLMVFGRAIFPEATWHGYGVFK